MIDRKNLAKLRNATVDDIINDPHAYGFYSFQEFARNPEKYIGKTDELFGRIDQSGETIKSYIRKHIYKFKKWKTKSLEELETIIKDHGFEIWDMDFKGDLINHHGGKCDCVIELFPKGEGKKAIGT